MWAWSFDRTAMVVAIGFALMIVGTGGTCSLMSGQTDSVSSPCASRTTSSSCTMSSTVNECSGTWASLETCCWTETTTISCQWSDESQNKYAQTSGGSVGASVFLGIIYIVILSLPLCCGIMKDRKNIVFAVACVIGFLGFLNIFIPLMGSMGACRPVAKDVCDSCEEGAYCDEATIESACNALGFLFVYTFACGWIACILGITAASMSICVCCSCGGMKADQQDVVLAPTVMQQVPVQGQVVTPVVVPGKRMDAE
eukprot:TRINITY_DN34707_c0_g1_i1.p1 TRINITY_DN34707_c0_g1~~TRINITY_DN34707_c0_g1_i1.p1  ORF type:complete len:276 (-),score=29.07 TRINITY_DN34707_c0_g1_i1:8-775(-)